MDARTMPTIPHWYCLRDLSHAAGLGAGHEALFALILDHGYDRWGRFRTRRSIEVDGLINWIIDGGKVINRRPARWDVCRRPRATAGTRPGSTARFPTPSVVDDAGLGSQTWGSA